MMWRTHALFGACSLWLLALIPNMVTPDTVGPLCALAAFGALLPDLDAEASKVRSLSVGGLRPFAPVSALAHRAWGHRGFLHSPLALLLLGGGATTVGLAWAWPPALALWLGYASHLAADACTRSGIPGWLNRPDRRIWLLPPGWRFATGSAAEDLLLPFLALGTLLLILAHYPAA